MKKFLVIFAIVALIASPAMAAEWNFFGSARMSTFSEDVDPGSGADSDQDTTWALQGNSRIGANVKAGDVTGAFEYGTGVNVRKLYGEWNFGAGALLVGQTYTPANFFPSNQVWAGDADLLPYGGIYRGRHPMIQLKFGTFKLAFVSPDGANDLGTGGDVDVTYPQIELSYKFKTDMFYVDVFGGYQTYEIEMAPKLDVDSYIAGANLGLTFGPASIMGSAWLGKNTGPYGMWVESADDPVMNAAGTEIIDNDLFGWLAVVNFKANDMLSFEAGYGRVSTELDVDAAQSDDTSSVYVNAVITFAPGVFIVPEIGMVDYEDDAAGAEQGELTYFGAKWQINF
jgi:hypothetical protein